GASGFGISEQRFKFQLRMRDAWKSARALRCSARSKRSRCGGLSAECNPEPGHRPTIPRREIRLLRPIVLQQEHRLRYARCFNQRGLPPRQLLTGAKHAERCSPLIERSPHTPAPSLPPPPPPAGCHSCFAPSSNPPPPWL